MQRELKTVESKRRTAGAVRQDQEQTATSETTTIKDT